MNLIKISCETGFKLNYKEIKPFQGNLKDLSVGAYNRLKNEIIKTGFAFPIHIWDAPDGSHYCVGGHQRLKTLERLVAEGYEVPEIPVAYVYAESFEEAKRRVLQDAAQYGKIESQGLYEFLHESKLDIQDVLDSFVLPEVNLTKFAEGFFDITKIEGLVKNSENSSTGLNQNQTSASSSEAVNERVDSATGELIQDTFQQFECKCPRCGFEFNKQE